LKKQLSINTSSPEYSDNMAKDPTKNATAK